MNSRMEKYSSGTSVKERTKKNEKLYEEVQDMNIDYIDIDVDNAIELNPYGTNNRTRSEYKKQRELNDIISAKEEKKEYVEDDSAKEEKIYDINEILKLAKENKLFEDESKKRLINTEYNILTKLDIEKIDKEENISKESLKDLIDKVYENEKKDEDKDLFANLLAPENEENDKVDVKLETEVSKSILDEDKEEDLIPEYEEQEAEKDEKKDEDTDTTDVGTTTDLNIEINKSNKSVAFIVIFVILIFAFIGYILYKYFSA